MDLVIDTVYRLNTFRNIPPLFDLRQLQFTCVDPQSVCKEIGFSEVLKHTKI